MWVAFVVALLSSGSIGVQSAPTTFASQEECQEANAKVEEMVKESSDVKAYAFKCVKIEKTDVKRNGKDV